MYIQYIFVFCYDSALYTLGCFHFMFLSRSDADNHEKLMHPGQRLQRRLRHRCAVNGKAVPPLRFKCQHPGCGLAFSTPTALEKHKKAYHESDWSRTVREGRMAREANPTVPPLKPKRARRIHKTGRPNLSAGSVPVRLIRRHEVSEAPWK